MPRNIMVPLDGTAFSEEALPAAESLARAAKATLHVVRVHVPATHPPVSLEGMPVIDPERDAGRWSSERAYVRRIADRLTVRGAHAVRTTVMEGPVAEALTTYGLLNDVDLIVMSTHGRNGLARAWMGSVADAVLRDGPAPLLLLRPATERPNPDVSRDPPLIVIALDGSRLAEEILEPAVEMGQAMDAEYVLVRVAAQPDAEAADYLMGIAWWMRDRGLKVHTRLIPSDSPAEAILEEAQKTRATFVAMATHGRSGLPRLLMGSVAARVLSGVPVPLLLCRPVDEPHRRRTRPVAVGAAF